MPATSTTPLPWCFWFLLMWLLPWLMGSWSWWVFPSLDGRSVTETNEIDYYVFEVAAFSRVDAVADRNKDSCRYRDTIYEVLVLGANFENLVWILAVAFVFGHSAWCQHQSSHILITSSVVTSCQLPQFIVESPITVRQVKQQLQLTSILKAYCALNVITILSNLWFCFATYTPFALFLF